MKPKSLSQSRVLNYAVQIAKPVASQIQQHLYLEPARQVWELTVLLHLCVQG